MGKALLLLCLDIHIRVYRGSALNVRAIILKSMVAKGMSRKVFNQNSRTVLSNMLMCLYEGSNFASHFLIIVLAIVFDLTRWFNEK